MWSSQMVVIVMDCISTCIQFEDIFIYVRLDNKNFDYLDI